MKIFVFFLLTTLILPSICMMRRTPTILAMHRSRNGKPVARGRQITIHNTEYGIIETLRLKECPLKEVSNTVPTQEKKLSPEYYLKEKHYRVKRKPNTISQKRKVYINGKEFAAYME